MIFAPALMSLDDDCLRSMAARQEGRDAQLDDGRLCALATIAAMFGLAELAPIALYGARSIHTIRA